MRWIVLAFAGCGSAAADQPRSERSSGIRPPAAWQALPSVADAARAAASATGVTVDGSEAWGEPAMGCYALWIALRGAGG